MVERTAKTDKQKPRRIRHLDSLRGIAASMVVLAHCFFVYEGPDDAGIVTLLGPGAVLFFFLLSGYVLGRSVTGTPVTDFRSFAAYVVRRIFRLYPAFLFALVLYALATTLPALPAYKFSSGKTLWLGSSAFAESPSWWLDQVFLVNFSLILVAWTLPVEFVCSLAVPFLCRITRPLGFASLLLICLLGWWMVSSGSFSFGDNSIFGYFAWSLKYLFVFYCGFLLNRMQSLYEGVGGRAEGWILALCLALLLPFAWVGNAIYHSLFWLQVPMALVFMILLAILIPCRNGVIRKLLHSCPLLLLGRCSYSIYLLHVLAICAGLWIMTALIQDRLPNIVAPGVSGAALSSIILFVIAWPITLLLAGFTERFVERPLNETGHRIGKRIAGLS